jgi:K+-sensing histidine kinase KdpD
VELEVQLIDDLLDLTKVARGKLQLHRQYVEAHELVDRTLRIVDHELLKKKLLLRVHLNAQHHLLHVDPARMQQVFWNIIKVPLSHFISFLFFLFANIHFLTWNV